LWVSIDGGKQWAQYKGRRDFLLSQYGISLSAARDDLVLATMDAASGLLTTSIAAIATPDLMSKDAVLLDSTSIQYLNSQRRMGGRRCHVLRPQSHTRRFHHVLQKGRHIFGDMKIEIIDPEAKWWIRSRAANTAA